MMKLLLVIICVLIALFHVAAFHQKSFDVIRGCKQYDSVGGYNDTVIYFAADSMQHVGRTSNSQFFRIGILGPMGAHIRYGETLFPYDKDVIEIVFLGWGKTKSVGQRQHRTASNYYVNHELAEVKTPNLLMSKRPVVFLLEVFNNGTVKVGLDGQTHPFLIFHDNYQISPNYIWLLYQIITAP